MNPVALWIAAGVLLLVLALPAVAQLYIDKGRANLQPGAYNRADWPHWLDPDGNGFNTRAEILIRDAALDEKIIASNTHGITAGKWHCPYSNQLFFDAVELDIDHVVPLSWAHSHGGAKWSKRKKRQFANDHNNLLAVSAELNRIKGDKGPDRWLPPNKGAQCAYIRRFDAVVTRYGLQYTPGEIQDMVSLLGQCQ